MNKILFALFLLISLTNNGNSQMQYYTITGFFAIQIRDKNYYDRLDAIAQKEYNLQVTYVEDGKKAYDKGDFETVLWYGKRINEKSLWDYRYLFICVGAYKMGKMSMYHLYVKRASYKVKPEIVRLIKMEVGEK